MSERVLILGAGSGIARAAARQLAREGSDLILAARRPEALERDAADLAIRAGVRIAVEAFDALDFAGHEAFLDRCWKALGEPIDGVLLCYGEMSDQEEAQADPALARGMIDVNTTSAICLLEGAARRMETLRHGWICAISSVAGDLGRRRNYLYGATKAALQVALQGLGARLARSGIRVTDVRPGVVDTGMTFGVPGVPRGLAAAPERVARDALRGVRRGRAVVYTPGYWRAVMAVLRLLPTPLLRRLDL